MKRQTVQTITKEKNCICEKTTASTEICGHTTGMISHTGLNTQRVAWCNITWLTPRSVQSAPKVLLDLIFLYFVDRASRYKFLLITNLTHFLNVFIYFNSLHVSSITVLIIRRSNCINTSSGMINLCKWLHGMPVRHTKQSLTQTNHTRWCINTIRSPDDEHCDARNM